MSDYRNISIKKELADTVEKFINDNPDFGFRSIAQFLESCARNKLVEMGFLGRHKVVKIEHFNLSETGVKLLDRKLGADGKLVTIEFRPEGPYCIFDETNDCVHTKYVMRQADILQVLAEKKK